MDSSSSSLTPGGVPDVNCAYCGAPGARMQCAACKAVVYCSKQCQKLAWRGHKKACLAELKRPFGVWASHTFGLWARHRAALMPHAGPFFCVPSTEIHHRYTQSMTDALTKKLQSFYETNEMYIGTKPTSTSKTVYICTQPTPVIQVGEPHYEACLSAFECDTSTVPPTQEQLAKFKSDSSVTLCRE